MVKRLTKMIDNPVLNWIFVFLWASLIFYLSSIPGLTTGLGIYDLILRKFAHIFEYFFLTYLLYRAWKSTKKFLSFSFFLFYGAFLSFLYAISDEIHQSFVPGRGPSIIDVFIDSIGIILCLIILKRRFND